MANSRKSPFFAGMTPDDVRSFCLSLPHAVEDTPFGPEALVYKVAGKMFALLLPDDAPPRLNLKCEPDYALELRDRHAAIRLNGIVHQVIKARFVGGAQHLTQPRFAFIGIEGKFHHQGGSG